MSIDTSRAPDLAGASQFDLSTLTVEKVQEGFRSGAFNSETLTKACLAQIEK